MAHRAIGAVTSAAFDDAAATPPGAVISPAAASPAASGIILHHTPAGLRLIASPALSWRHLSRWYLAAILPAAVSVWLGTDALALGGGKPEPGLWPPVVEFACIALAIGGHAIWRLRHRLVIDVTRDELAVSVVNLAGFGDRTAWPRRDVRDVKVNPHNGKLLLRIAGQDSLEYRLSPDRQAARQAAEAIREAVFAGSFTAPGGSVSAATVRPPAYRRWIGGAVSSVAAIVGLVGFGLLICGNVTGAMLIALSVVALTITLGLMYGTQEKKFFT